MKKFSQVSIIFIILFIVFQMIYAATDKETKRIQYSIEVLNNMITIPDKTIPVHILQHAHAIAIIPGVVKGAFGFGGRWGLGILSVHTDTGWTNPSFISVAGGSVGWQFGAQSSDFVLVFRTSRSVENLKKGKLTFGANVSATAGPVGRNAEASTDIQLKSEILSYARSRGLFLGASLEGTSLRIDNEANNRFYKGYVSAEDVFENKVSTVPEIVQNLNQSLVKATKENGSDTTGNKKDSTAMDTTQKDTVKSKDEKLKEQADSLQKHFKNRI